MLEDEESAGGDTYVVCRKCGARIKATRERCLRCFEPLHPDESQLTVWRSLRISDQIGVVVGALAIVAVGALVWVLWSTADRSPRETPAKPVERANAGTPPGPDTTAPAAGPDTPAAGAAAVLPGETPVAADDLESTRRAFEDKLRVNPNDPVALDGLGIIEQRLGNLPEALAAFKRASEVAPGNATARTNLAAIEARLGQWDKAVVDYRVAARLAPNDSGAHYNLALALQQTHDDQGAVGEFEIALQLAPRDAAAHRSFATSLERIGRSADAAREYQRYLELAPDAPDASTIRERLQRSSKP